MKKVLIITYYWPPSGGGGVQRWLKFAKYLPQFGWEPIVFTPENPDFDIKDQSLLKDVDANLEVLKLPIWEPYHLFKKLNKGKNLKQGLTTDSNKQSVLSKIALFVRGNFFIPDPRRYWVRPSSRFLTQYIQDNNIDVVVTTGPPHSMHLIGLKLKKKLGVKWLADFRDPWSKWDMLDNFKLSPLARLRHQNLEKEVLKNANAVLTVSKSWALEFDEIYSRKYEVITNGFDHQDFQNSKVKNTGNDFIISHFGLINNFRNPRNFWEAIKQLSENLEFKNKVKIRLYGTIESNILDELKTDEILKDLIEIKSPVSHEEVLNAYTESDLLLLLLNDSNNAKGHIPGKLFEYMASETPILALGPPDGDSAQIINDTNTGNIFNWSELENIKTTIYLHFEKNHHPKIDKSVLNNYSREFLTSKLSEVLNNLP
jgi:glycosyltransferase involved in cell wall biosynthesis